MDHLDRKLFPGVGKCRAVGAIPDRCFYYNHVRESQKKLDMDFSIPISLHDCVHYLYITFAPMNNEFQVGKSRPRLHPCFGENAHLRCFFKTKKRKNFLNETFRQYVSHHGRLKDQITTLMLMEIFGKTCFGV
ncbi:hypothetical protein H5410_047437 [Solanum commersonii]|uniref:Uncharacterized protein n=1 Tax=Solanum commersonii TaxID=4109 RepID=A0A9J5XF51_SOLCO|nr:hypothetical protein H5410_047437 [Solanum commersonii]